MRNEYRAKLLKVTKSMWVYGTGVYENDKNTILVTVSSNDSLHKLCIDPNTICRNTGIYDVDRIQIYENDIISVGEYSTTYYRITYDKENIVWQAIDEDNNAHDFTPRYRNMKIIGNIFDNPDKFGINRKILNNLDNKRAKNALKRFIINNPSADKTLCASWSSETKDAALHTLQEIIDSLDRE